MTARDDVSPFTPSEFARRYAGVRGMLAREGLAALLVYSTPSAADYVQYLADLRTLREAMLVFPLMGDPVLFVQMYNHVPDARRVACVRDVRWGGHDNAEAAAERIRELGSSAERIGIVGPLPWRQHATLAALLPKATLVDATAAFQRLRLVKSDEELALLARGAALTDRAMEALEHEARPGLSERDLVTIIEQAYVGEGGQTHIHYLASTPMRQPAVCVPAQHPSGRVLQAGDVLITEISAHDHGYPGQIQRPYAVGAPPTPEYQRLYAVAVEAFARIAGVVRAGAAVAEVVEAAEGIHAAGYSIYDDLVHGFGGGYLPPIVRTRQTGGSRTPSFVFEENMTVVIQPNVITPDERTGLQVGELVRVTATGIESLHHYPMRFVRCG